MSNFLIKTPGRTGSHIILSFLETTENNHVVHSQDFWCPENTEEWDLILSKRRNSFDHACSRIVASHTQQWGPYNDVSKDLKITPDFEYIMVSCSNSVLTYETHNQMAKKYTWKNVYTFYYEDIINDDSSLKMLDSTGTTGLKKDMKSPHNYKEIITNYSELKKEFEVWEKFIGLKTP